MRSPNRASWSLPSTKCTTAGSTYAVQPGMPRGPSASGSGPKPEVVVDHPNIRNAASTGRSRTHRSTMPSRCGVSFGTIADGGRLPAQPVPMRVNDPSRVTRASVVSTLMSTSA